MSADNNNTKKPDALELGNNDVKESHPLDAKNFPHCYFSPRSEKWIIKNTMENLDYFLKYNRSKVALNAMSHGVEVDLGVDCPDDANNDDKASIITNLVNIAGFERKFSIEKWLRSLALINSYHPVKQWILSKPLYAGGQMEKLTKCIPAENPVLSSILFKRWAISAVAALFEPNGISAQGALVFCGPQYTFKTSFIEFLCEESMGAVLLGHTLDVSDKDTIIRALSHWIVELGELDATFRKSDIAKLKSFITQKKDSFRVVYGATDTKQPRRTVFAATVNDENFLVDETGNRRFWTIKITGKMNTIGHGVDMQQFWREAYELYLQGERWMLSKEELAMLNESNKNHEIQNPMEELILQTYDWESPCVDRKTATDILIDFGIMPSSPQFEKYKRSVGKSLKKLNIEEFRTKKIRGYIMPKKEKNTIHMR